jgi:MFS family permease
MEEHTGASLSPVARCIGGNVVFGAGLFFHAFLYNFYVDALRLSEAVMGYAGAALTAGGLVMLLPAGRLVDRFGPRAGMAAAAVVAGVGLALGAVVVTPWPMYAAAAVAGAGGALWRVAVAPALMRLTNERTRARAFAWNVGLIVLSGGLGIAVAGAVPGWFQSVFHVSAIGGVRLALTAGALATVASVMPFLALSLPVGAGAARLEGGAEAPRGEAPRPGVPGALPFIGIVAVWMLGAALLAPFLNLYFARRYGLSIGGVGGIFAAAHVLWALAVLGSGEIASRAGARWVLPLVALLFAPAAWGLGMAPGLAFAGVLYLIQGAIGPITNPLIDQVLLADVAPDQQGAVSGWRNVAADVSGMVGASVGGVLLAERGFGLLFGAAGLLGLVGSVALLGWLRRPAWGKGGH